MFEPEPASRVACAAECFRTARRPLPFGANEGAEAGMVVPLIGYVDRFSGRPGECIAVKVSSQFDAPYRADMVRIRRVRIAHGGSTRASQMPKYRRSVKVVSCSRNHL